MTKLRILSVVFLLAFACAVLAPVLIPSGAVQASGNTGDRCPDDEADCG